MERGLVLLSAFLGSASLPWLLIEVDPVQRILIDVFGWNNICQGLFVCSPHPYLFYWGFVILAAAVMTFWTGLWQGKKRQHPSVEVRGA